MSSPGIENQVRALLAFGPPGILRLPQLGSGTACRVINVDRKSVRYHSTRVELVGNPHASSDGPSRREADEETRSREP